jgi:signal transduction histidine kinase
MIGAMLDVTQRDRAERRQRALVTLSDHMRTLTDPSELAYAASEVLGSALGVSRAGYGEVDKLAETISITRDWNAPGIRSLAGILQFRDYGTYIEDLKRGETVVFEDAEKDPRTAPNAAALKAISAQSVVNMPVTENGNFVALLYLNHATARRWSVEELDFIREVADRTRTGIERRRVEQELMALMANLEHQVEQRTDELMIAEQALRQAQKMEAVGQLTGGLAHDFNNLLTGITGSLELMESRIRQGRLSELDRYISAAQSAAKRAANLTHRLLAFSRQQTLDPKPTDVNRLVNGMEELMRRTIGPEIALEVVTAGGIWSTLVDPPQLENSLLNLCINARDAMPHGGRITIETANKWLDERAARERQLRPGQYISLCVTDTGSGMTSDIMTKAFDPFLQPNRPATGRVLGFRWSTALCVNQGDRYGFIQRSDKGQRCVSTCLDISSKLRMSKRKRPCSACLALNKAKQFSSLMMSQQRFLRSLDTVRSRPRMHQAG